VSEAKPSPPIGIEIDEDLSFTRKEWTAQRLGWAAMAAVVLAGLLGLFGGGPLSNASTEVGPLRVAYDRFERRHSPAELAIESALDSAEAGEVELWLGDAFLDAVEIEAFSPEPEEFRAGADRVVYTFQVDDPSRPAKIAIDYQPDQVGPVVGRLGLVDGPELEFSQWVYP